MLLSKINLSFVMTSNSDYTDPTTPPWKITRTRASVDAAANGKTIGEKKGNVLILLSWS